MTTDKVEVTVRVSEWVLQDQTVTVLVGPDEDIMEVVREDARAAALETDRWRDRDSQGFLYTFKDPFTGREYHACE